MYTVRRRRASPTRSTWPMGADEFGRLDVSAPKRLDVFDEVFSLVSGEFVDFVDPSRSSMSVVETGIDGFLILIRGRGWADFEVMRRALRSRLRG